MYVFDENFRPKRSVMVRLWRGYSFLFHTALIGSAVFFYFDCADL